MHEVAVPIRPTQEEVDKHCLNHAVYRNWCEFCVRGRGKENPHRKVGERVMQIPVLCMGYGFMREKPEEAGRVAADIVHKMQENRTLVRGHASEQRPFIWSSENGSVHREVARIQEVSHKRRSGASISNIEGRSESTRTI